MKPPAFLSEQGHTEMSIGLKEFRDLTKLTFPQLLLQPSVRKSM
jgi:hypothetical protein